uniref:Pheromone binding protein 5 n=1 Tax=Cyrtotrachelus buqueti TaxID=1892066 RepID=A0A1L3KPR8_9CUCU|nr:pheromone binding protein 5 [Cyrtotrachelus buqueti]
MSSLTKIVVIFAVLSITAAKFDESMLSDDIKTILKGLHDVCVGKTGVEEALIDKLKEAEFSEDQKLKCYIQCLLAQTGAMDMAGHIDIEAATELIPEQVKAAMIRDVTQCAKESEHVAEHCDRAYTTLKCFYKVNPDVSCIYALYGSIKYITLLIFRSTTYFKQKKR